MIAAVYARKSTDQTAVADEAKSVTRQIDHAKAYAARKGWTVPDERVYVDDGVSGAEFANRPGFVRLMAALKPRPPFQVLIMSEESRLGRESIETAYALKQLIQAGVAVWFYLEDRQRTFNSPTDKFLMSVTAFADELERQKAGQRVYDAMRRKATAGQVTGGRVFGYDNVEVCDASGSRSHVERSINEAEAAVVLRMFELCAEGAGLARITKTLNADRVRAPRPQQGRPTGWAISSVRAVLRRPLYKGEVLWNQTRKRDGWGQQHQQARPEADWMRTPAPALRIVSEDLWSRAQRQLATRRARYSAGDRSFRESRYLLSGFARCALCGGGFASHGRMHGKQRVQFYACVAHWKRGPEVCGNGLVGRMEAIDAEVLATLRDDILRPSVVEHAVALALEEWNPRRAGERQAAADTELRAIDAEHAAVMADITRGGDVDVLVQRVGRLQALQARRLALTSTGAARAILDRQAAAVLHDTATPSLEQRLRDKLLDWRGLLTRNVESGREVLKALLVGPLRFTPLLDQGRQAYRFTGVIALDRLVAGVIELKTLTRVASPEGTAPLCNDNIERRGFVRAA